MIGSAIAPVICNEKLAAPNGAVGPVPRSVERHSDHRLLAAQAIFRHARGDVRVMVLNADRWQALAFGTCERIPRRHIVRMEIVRDHLRMHAKKLCQVRHPVFERTERFVILQVADVMAEESIAVAREAKGVF